MFDSHPDHTMKEVKILTDEIERLYLIPNDKEIEFLENRDDAEMIDSGEFGVKWNKYMLNRGINSIQLWAEI